MQSIRRARGVAAADGAGLQRPTAARAAPAPRGTNYQVTKLQNRGIFNYPPIRVGESSRTITLCHGEQSKMSDVDRK